LFTNKIHQPNEHRWMYHATIIYSITNEIHFNFFNVDTIFTMFSQTFKLVLMVLLYIMDQINARRIGHFTLSITQHFLDPTTLILHTSTYFWGLLVTVMRMKFPWTKQKRNHWLTCQGRNCIRLLYRPSSYRTVNHLCVGYKNQSVNTVKRNIRCLFWDPRKTHKLILGRTQNFLMLELVVYKVSLRP
jgi:hypothetical protein